MRISVIIPIYNANINDLNRCVSSILHQTYSDFEILIVDDGSQSDVADCLDILARRNQKIRVFHKKNEGVSVARNYGVANAAGSYIMFVDCDDILTPWALEQAVLAIDRTEADIAIGRIVQTAIIPEQFPQESSNVYLQVLENQQDRADFERHIFLKNVNDWGRNEKGWMFNPEGCWAHLVKREVAETIPFVPGIAIAEDTIWAVELLRNQKMYKICLVDDLWYYYIQNDLSVLHKYSKDLGEKIGKAIRILNPLYETESHTEIYNAYLQWLLSKLKQIITGSYMHPECDLDFREKQRLLNKMLETEPWKDALKTRNIASKSYKIKMFLYRKKLMLPLLMIKTGIKGE